MITIQVRVKPNARESQLETPSIDGEPWTARLKSPPVDGKANAELIRMIAEHFGCPKNRVAIKSGAGARLKRVTVDL